MSARASLSVAIQRECAQHIERAVDRMRTDHALRRRWWRPSWDAGYVPELSRLFPGPVLLIVPAPIKRHHIWDLMPGRSVVARALAADLPDGAIATSAPVEALVIEDGRATGVRIGGEVASMVKPMV